MRITVGGVLLVGGLAAAGFAFVRPSADGFFSDLKRPIIIIRDKISTTFGLGEPKLEPSPLSPFNTLSTGTAPATPVSPAVTQTAAVPAEPVQAEAPTVEPVVTPKPVSKSRRARKTKTTRKTAKKSTKKAVATSPAAVTPAPVKQASKEAAPQAVVPAPAPAPKVAPPAAAKTTTDKDVKSLIGQYVTLTLQSGREVKGILEEAGAASYKVELPGLGSFNYPKENVQSVKRTE